MQPSARDKRIRICGGLVIMALAVLSLFMVFASGRERGANIPLDALYGIQALFTLGAGIYLVSGWRKAAQMVMAPGRARRIALAAIAAAGTAAVTWGFTEGAKAEV